MEVIEWQDGEADATGREFLLLSFRENKRGHAMKIHVGKQQVWVRSQEWQVWILLVSTGLWGGFWLSGTWLGGDVGQGKYCIGLHSVKGMVVDIDSGLVGLYMTGVLLKSSSFFYFPFLHFHLSLFNSFQFFAEIPFILCMLATFF